MNLHPSCVIDPVVIETLDPLQPPLLDVWSVCLVVCSVEKWKVPHLAYRHGRDMKKYKLTVSAPLMDSVSLFFLLYSCRSHLPGFRGEHIKMPYAKVSERSADTPSETWNGLGVWWCPRQCQCSVQPCCNLLVRRTCLSPRHPPGRWSCSSNTEEWGWLILYKLHKLAWSQYVKHGWYQTRGY